MTQPGQLIGGRYRLVKTLGAGGFGRVWQARDESLRIDVAVKELWLPPAMSAEEQNERRKRARREARNAAKLRDHPNIVTVHDVVMENDAPWIVMQLISGCSLKEQLDARGPLPAERAAEVARALLKALAAAHAKGIVHRDVKPANVMLAEGGEVLLTDFGIAVHRADTVLTESGGIIGTAEYLAPERARGEKAGSASDLFSLGVTLYHAVEGVSPFHREPPIAALHAVVNSEAPPPGRAGRLAPLLWALMQKDPAKRPSIQQALAILDEPPAKVFEPTTVPLPPLKPPYRPAPAVGPKAKKTGAGWLVAVALAALVATILYHGSRGFADYLSDDLQLSADAFSAQQGDCLHHGPKGWVEVPCFSASADHTVLQRYASATGSPCSRVAGWTSQDAAIADSGKAVELCVSPRPAPTTTTEAGVQTPAYHPSAPPLGSHSDPPTQPSTSPPAVHSDPPVEPSTQPAVTDPPPVHVFNPADLDSSATDQTPLTTAALLPASFTDSENVQYTRRSAGLQNCLSWVNDDVKNVLLTTNCGNALGATYVDRSNQVLVAVVIVPMADARTAVSAYNQVKSAYSSDWGILCPQTGAGSQICDYHQNFSHATQAGWTDQNHRYLIHTFTVYINLTQDHSVQQWVNAAAQQASTVVGPQNYAGNH